MAGKKRKKPSIQLPLVRFYKNKEGKFVDIYMPAWAYKPDYTVKRTKKKSNI